MGEGGGKEEGMKGGRDSIYRVLLPVRVPV